MSLAFVLVAFVISAIAQPVMLDRSGQSIEIGDKAVAVINTDKGHGAPQPIDELHPERSTRDKLAIVLVSLGVAANQ